MARRSRSIKLVCVGDGAVGKTCLLTVFATGKFPQDYVPTIFENFSGQLSVDGVDYQIQLWDTSGQEDLDTIRTLSYAQTNVFLVCFSAHAPLSGDNVKKKWIPEIKANSAGNVPILLVATKTDLADAGDTTRRLAAEIDAAGFVSCSALRGIGVKEVFEEAVRIAVGNENPEDGGCCRLG